ncbi:hypothetical protein ERJ75_000570100 [Trypanosoma vivax]|nr:hypothetical protein ERJ75_000570100 [Trypanosoma vivax]
MLAAWRAVCLAALSAALAATLATGNDADAGDTVRDFGLVCNVFRNVLQARDVAKAQKARAAEVALAIEQEWLGKASEQFKEDVVYSPAAEAQKQKDEAKKLRGQAAELAERIDALSYSAILGNITDGREDRAEGANNVLFKAMAGAGKANTGFADERTGTELSNDMMWLCNVAGANAGDKTAPFKKDDDNACPCTKDGKAAQYLESGEFWKPLKHDGGSSNAGDIAKGWAVAKRICLKGRAETTLTKDQTRKPLSVAHALSTAVTRVMAAINTDGKADPTRKFCLGQRVRGRHATGTAAQQHASATISTGTHTMVRQNHRSGNPARSTARRHDTTRPTANRGRRSQPHERPRSYTQITNTGSLANKGRRTTRRQWHEHTKHHARATREQEDTHRRAGRANDAQKAEVAGQGNEECGPAHPAWNTDTKTCSTTRRSAHVTAILTLLATALDAQDTRMAQQILQ